MGIYHDNEAESHALSEIHCICADAGIEPGHVVKRVQELAARALAAEAKVRDIQAALTDYERRATSLLEVMRVAGCLEGK